MNPDRLILACRSLARGEAAISQLTAETGFKRIELRIVDLNNFASVSAFSDDLDKEGIQIDVAVLNAGIHTFDYEKSSDGYESTIQVNHLSTSLLAFRLVPRLLKTAQERNTISRLTVVGSGLHYWAKIPEAALQSSNIFEKLSDPSYCTSTNMRQQYAITKLMTTFFTRSLSDWLGPDAPLVVTNVHPGLVATTLNRNRGVFLSIVAFLMKVLVMRTPEQGARTIAWASLAGTYGPGPAANELRGAYVNSFEINEPSEYVVSKEHDVGRRLWDETLQILGNVDGIVAKMIKDSL